MSRRGQRERWQAPERLRWLEAWARRGYSRERIARYMDVRPRTLRRWLAEDADMAAAIRRGENAYLDVEDAVYRMSTGYTQQVTKHYKTTRDEVDEATGQRMRTEDVVARPDEVYVHPSITAAVFWMKRFEPEDARDETASPEALLVEAARALIGESRALVEAEEDSEGRTDD